MNYIKTAFRKLVCISFLTIQLSAAYTLTEPDRKASSSTWRDLINEGSATLVPIVPILADLSCKMCEKLDTQESRNKCKLRFCENITSSRVMAETPAQADFRQRVTSLIQNEIDGARTNQKPAVVNALLSDMLCAACEKLKTTTEKSNCRKRHCLQPQKKQESFANIKITQNSFANI